LKLQRRKRENVVKTVSTQVEKRTRTRIVMGGREHYERERKRMWELWGREKERQKEKVIAAMRRKERYNY